MLRLDILHTFDVAEDDVGDIGIMVPTTVRGLIGEVFVETEVVVCVGRLGLGALEGGTDGWWVERWVTRDRRERWCLFD